MQTPRDIKLKIGLVGGEAHEVLLPEDAPELVALFSALSGPPSESRFVQLPLDDGKRAWSFQTSRIISIVSDPPVVLNREPAPGSAVRPRVKEDDQLHERRARGLDPTLLKPCRQKGVRAGKILGSLFLEIPGRPDTVSLNASGAAIWEVCDGTRSLAAINHELETRFEMPAGSLRADVEVVIKRLEDLGAVRLEPV